MIPDAFTSTPHPFRHTGPRPASPPPPSPDKEMIFLTQQQVGKLFNVRKAAISKHIKNIFDTGELNKKSTVSILETVQIEGKRKITRKIEYYNLDLILSIGY